MFKDKNVLVLGASGFIGTNLILKLIELGAKVKGAIHHKQPSRRLFKESLSFVYGDLRCPQYCESIMKGMDYVFMCAAHSSGAAVIEKTPLAHVTPNIIMNSLTLEAAHKAGVKKFVFISSSVVYPDSDLPMKEEDAKFDFYDKYFCVGWMKSFSEILCQMYSSKISTPMKTLIVRPSNCYGPYDDFDWETSHVVPALIRKAVERHDPLVVWGDGTLMKDLIYIDDFIDGMLLAVEKEIDIINISTGQCYSVQEILQWIFAATNYSPKVVYNTNKPTMISKRIVDCYKARCELGFKAKTSLKDGIQKTVDWYASTLS